MMDRQKVIEELNAQIVDRIDGREVTRGDLSAAFDRVANPEDWKDRIDATIEVDGARDLETVLRSIAFFTATNGTASIVKPGTYRITAEGYRMGPAGDH